ncbi:hypothetical protein ACX93W_04345 [Paenibacillus sp. CAU 1782]
MKRVRGILLFLSLALGLSACSAENDREYDFQAGLNSALIDPSIRTMDDIVALSDYIIVGELASSSEFSKTTIEYSVKVKEQLKGRDHLEEHSISVFSAEPLAEEGTQYLLFLEQRNSEYFEGPTYASLIHPNPLEGGRFAVGPFSGKTSGQIRDEINKSSTLSTFDGPANTVLEQAQDLSQLIDASDYVLRLKPTSVIEENKAIKLAASELIKQYKGDERIASKEAFFLPQYIELEEEYLVFYRLQDDSDASENPVLTLTARHGSVIAKSDAEHWGAAISALESTFKNNK